MTVAQALLTFVVAAGLLTLTPGVDTALVLRAAAVDGPRRAVLAATGVGIGCLIWGAAASLGLGAVLAASDAAFAVLKWGGAVYLAWLGVGLLSRPAPPLRAGDDGVSASPLEWLRKGLLTNLLNPKVGVFYVTFLPQFIPDGMPTAAFSFGLAVIHVVLSAVWMGVLIGACIPLGRFLGRPAVTRTINRVTGGVFIVLGAKLALLSR